MHAVMHAMPEGLGHNCHVKTQEWCAGRDSNPHILADVRT